MFVDECLEFHGIHEPGGTSDNLSVLHCDDGREQFDLIPFRGRWFRVDIDGLEGNPGLILACDGGKNRFHFLTGTAPVGFEFDDSERSGIRMQWSGETESQEREGKKEGAFFHMGRRMVTSVRRITVANLAMIYSEC